jgi:PilZ domain
MAETKIPERRRAKRTPLKRRASLVVKRGTQHERVPCIVLDSSPDGFRMGGTARLKRGQLVEVILSEDPFNTIPCSVIWVGKPGSKQGGEVGLQAVARPA